MSSNNTTRTVEASGTDGRSAVLADPRDPMFVPGATVFGNRYSRAFKLKVLKEADACTEPGEIGRLLRRHGITHTTLTSFRRQRASGGLAPTASGSKRVTIDTARAAMQARRVMELERENRGLRKRLSQAEAIIEVQKNVSRLLDISLGGPERRAND